MKLPILTTSYQSGSLAGYRNETVPGFVQGISLQKIQFEDGWDDANNSDVRAHTTGTATTFLKGYSADLKSAIESSKCTIKVTKGCHQAGDPHFTLSEVSKGKKGKVCDVALYAGSKSIHIPC